MSEQEGSATAIRFGAFEVNLQARELHRRGLRLKIEEKPFQILAALLERPGQLITRQELRQRLWTPDTYVDFDRNLNTAVNKLRDTLGDSAENPRFVETLSRRGYRFIQPVEMAKGTTLPAAPESEAINSIAVLPFENTSGDPEVDYLSDGITESLISNLSQLAGVRVMARSTVFRYRGRGVDPLEVGRELRVHAVLTGRLVQRGDTLVIGAELVSTDSGFRLWGEQYNRKLPDIFEVEEKISREISERLRLRLTGEEKKRLTKRYTENAEAYRDYLKGRYCYFKMNEEGLGKSIGYFQDAILKDPHYALAYSGLADTYGLYGLFGLMPPREVMPRARELSRIALSLDDGLAETHASLASIKKSYEWDWVGAENEYLRALELNPNYATGHHWYADFLSSMGRSEEAMQEIHTAQELDPLSLVISMEVAWNWYMARQYEQSLEQSLKTLEIEPSFTPAQHTLGLAYLQLGKHTEAIRAFEKAKKGSGGNLVALAALGHAYAASGEERQANKALSELGKIAQRRYVPHYWSAIVHAGLGQQDEGFECLEKACEERDVWLVWLKAEPRFDNLRSDPRFENLLRRINWVP
ncbi:MAG TPA: winged helix-turn-helix domain-containing protein [Terriglobia bacterium]|nr:winged helix-turn-helix domain-containing protein [Terriglobia bacterium]